MHFNFRKKVQFINLRKNPIFSDSTLIEIDAHETQILNTMMLIYHTTCLELTNSSPWNLCEANDPIKVQGPSSQGPKGILVSIFNIAFDLYSTRHYP